MLVLLTLIGGRLVWLQGFQGQAYAEQAVKAAGKEGKVKIVGFDEDQQTLKGISEDVIDATVVQQPYEFGYQSMIYLAKYIEGDKSFIPENKQRIIPTQVIDKTNVKDFAAKVRELLKK